MTIKILITLVSFAAGSRAFATDVRPDLPKHAVPSGDALVIGNCDGQGAVTVPGKKAGEKLTQDEARSVTKKLMADWKKRNPGRKWAMKEARAETLPPSQRPQQNSRQNPQSSRGTGAQLGARQAPQPISPEKRDPKAAEKGPSFASPPAADPETAVATAQRSDKSVSHQQGIYTDISREDRKIWDLEQTKMIKMGEEIFHSGDLLGSKTAISCDMCHPNAANTHPETYPKYQVQLQRVALLRDMINWCIENPVKGPMLKDEDPKMRAIEAYILAQRAGVALQPGKH